MTITGTAILPESWTISSWACVSWVTSRSSYLSPCCERNSFALRQKGHVGVVKIFTSMFHSLFLGLFYLLSYPFAQFLTALEGVPIGDKLYLQLFHYLHPSGLEVRCKGLGRRPFPPAV
jgi:hypothetical protein